MLEVLRDSIWTFVGAVLALAAIVATLWVYVLQRPRRRLLVERVARVPLTTLGANRIPGLELRLNGELLQSASVIVIRITNSGNQPILGDDFERPLTFKFEEGSAVLHAEMSEPSPEDLKVATSCQGRDLQVERCLLNPGDTFLCRALVRDSRGRYEPSARVVGMKGIERSRPVSFTRPAAMIFCMAIAIIAFVLSPAPSSRSPAELRAEEIPYLLAMLGATLILAVVMVVDLKSRLQATRSHLRLLHAGDAEDQA